MPLQYLAPDERYYQPKKMNWWYEGIIDWMLSNPDKTLGDAAKSLNVTQAWLSTIVGTDMFQERLAERRQQLNDRLADDIVRKTTEVATLSLDLIAKRLKNQDVEKTKLPTLIEIADKSLARLGYGVPKGGGTTVNVQQQVIPTGASADALREAKAAIRGRQAGVIEEATIIEVPGNEQPSLFDMMDQEPPEGFRIPEPLEDDPLGELGFEVVADGRGLPSAAGGEEE